MKAKAFLALSLLTSQMAHEVYTTLILSGQIMPVACTIAIANGGIFDLGDIIATNLNATTPTDLPRITEAVNISCDNPTQVAVNSMDNRAGTVGGALGGTGANGVAAGWLFGLGTDTAGNNIGNYAMQYTTPEISGVAGTFLISVNAGATWTARQAEYFSNSAAGLVSLGTAGASSPTPIVNASFNLGLVSAIAPKITLDVTQLTTLDGSTTFTLFYL
jgi:hypothetical protein